jgi:hypothetical protein
MQVKNSIAKAKKGIALIHNPLACMVGTTGFEPVTPTVSG